MARKENLEFLKNIYPSAMSEKPFDALLTWIMGDEERSIAVCVHVAYGSMKRKVKELILAPKQNMHAHHKDIDGLIFRCIDA